MSETTTTGSRASAGYAGGAGGAGAGRRAGSSSPARPAQPAWRRPSGGLLFGIALVVILLVLPFYVNTFWLRVGFTVFGTAIGAMGLNLLLGSTGQLSLGHAFFVAVGGVSYSWLAGEASTSSTRTLGGLGLPPLLAMIIAVGLAGLAGLLFSPVAARLKGLYLGIASLGLVFVGQHVMNSATEISGGYNGRRVPDFSLFGFVFDDEPYLAVLGVPFGRAERLWYLGLFLALGCYLFARNLLNGRPGRALRTVRDSEIAAAVHGVDVQSYRAKAFLLSSMYAGLAGVLYALSIGSVAPESFTIEVSIQYLAMIVIGGLGSVGGAVAGAAFVSALPLVLNEYSESIPGLSEPGSGGISYTEAGKYAYGLAVLVVILFWPNGLAGITRQIKMARQSRRLAKAKAAGGPAPG